MRDVQLTYQGIKPYFTYTNEVGNTEYFEYRLKVNDVSVLSNVKNYEVELLINPILNKERHHYALCSKNGNTETSIGLVFPISLLDGTEEIFPKGQLDYFLIAYYVLLQRLEHVDSGTFSQNFEDNICVCVFNMKKAGGDPHQLSKCIHSLREYNYSYFIDHNSYQAIEGYKDDWYVRDSQKNIRVQQQVPILYQEEMIDVILRALPSISNVVHRFFFLYQIIEYLIREIQKQEISKVIKKYENLYLAFFRLV